MGSCICTSLAMHKTYFFTQNCRYARFTWILGGSAWRFAAIFKNQTQLVLSIYPVMISVYYQLSSGLICKYHRITHVRLSKHVHLFNILQENHRVQQLKVATFIIVIIIQFFKLVCDLHLQIAVRSFYLQSKKSSIWKNK